MSLHQILLPVLCWSTIFLTHPHVHRTPFAGAWRAGGAQDSQEEEDEQVLRSPLDLPAAWTPLDVNNACQTEGSSAGFVHGDASRCEDLSGHLLISTSLFRGWDFQVLFHYMLIVLHKWDHLFAVMWLPTSRNLLVTVVVCLQDRAKTASRWPLAELRSWRWASVVL